MDTNYIVDSAYYSKDFDGAIFDGPIRIYFVQSQEEKALELFHYLSKIYTQYSDAICKLNKKFNRKVFILMYPSLKEKCKYQPKGDTEKVFITPFLTDYIIGLCPQFLESNPMVLEPYLKFICENWIAHESGKIKSHFKKDFLMHLD